MIHEGMAVPFKQQFDHLFSRTGIELRQGGSRLKKRGAKTIENVPPQSARKRQGAGTPYQAIAAKKRFLELLNRSQWWEAEELANYQFSQICRLFDHAYNTVPFYKRRFSEVGLTSGRISPEDWHKIPILTRDDLQNQQIISNAIPPEHGRTAVTQTSGSTGQPVKLVGTQQVNAVWEAITVRDHLWHKRDFSGKLAVIRYNPSLDVPAEGLFSHHWGPATAHLFRTGPSMTFSVDFDIDRQLDWLVQHNPEYLLTYPSNLQALVERSEELGKKAARLKEVRTISETVSPELRAACLTSWGAKLVDSYTSEEVGYIALQCPENNQYHIQSENVLVEILDDQGNPCAPGETGRVVITSLHNYATPLIRYEIRDYAEVGEPCSCGRGLPVIRRVIGRQRNMLLLPNGERRWPITGFTRYHEVAPIRQFQFIQHSLEKIEMRFVSARKITSAEQQQLAEIINQSLGHPFSIQFSPMERIQRGVGGKYEEFISLL